MYLDQHAEKLAKMQTVCKGWEGANFHPSSVVKGRYCNCLTLVFSILSEIGDIITPSQKNIRQQYAVFSGAQHSKQSFDQNVTEYLNLEQTPFEKNQPGTLVTFNLQSYHFALVRKPGQIIHCTAGLGVRNVSINSPILRQKADRCFRIKIRNV